MSLRSLRARTRTALFAAIATTAIGAALPALADACTVASTPSKQAFTQFGDFSQYTPASGGTFESGTSGWTLNGSSVQSGNESYHVNAASDAHSLLVPATSQPVSAPICVSSATPTFRFLARQASSTWSEMNVNVLWTDASGVAHVSTAGGLSPTTSWAPTQVYNLGAMLGPLFQPGSTLSVRLQFVPASGGGPVAIDDVEVDPYSK